MRSASERLPLTSTLFTSAVTRGEPYTGSVTSGRLVAGPLRGMSALLLLRSVAAPGLLTVADPLGVEGASDDLVTHTRQVTNPAASHQHDGVLLEVVADSGDVGGDFDLARQPHPGHLAQRGVGLLRRGRVDTRADTPALGAALQGRGSGLGHLVLAALTDQLLDRGHRVSVFVLRAGWRDVFSYPFSAPGGAGNSRRLDRPHLLVFLVPPTPEVGCVAVTTAHRPLPEPGVERGKGPRAWPLTTPSSRRSSTASLPAMAPQSASARAPASHGHDALAYPTFCLQAKRTPIKAQAARPDVIFP